MSVISSRDSSVERLLYSPYKALDAVLDLGTVPQRLFRVFYPVWRVKVEGRQRIPTNYEELEWFLERGVHEVGLRSVEELAQFFGLEARFVHKLVEFLRSIGHVEGDDARLALTGLGLTSVQERIRYQDLETSARLYFDGFGSRPLTLEHYAIPMYTDLPSTRFKAFYDFEDCWNEKALDQLMERNDRNKYNLPDEVTHTELLDRELVYLPVYIIERRPDELEELASFLVFSRIRSLRDEVLETAVNAEERILTVLREARWKNLDEIVEHSLSRRGLGKDNWYLQRNGPWGLQVTVDTRAIGKSRHYAEGDRDSEKLAVRNVGKYLLAYDYDLAYDWCVWLTCDDDKVRRQAAIEQLIEWLQGVTAMPTAQDLHRRLATMRERLHVKTISTDVLMDVAEKRGLARAVERLELLVTDDAHS